jgi:hypothetical protein
MRPFYTFADLCQTYWYINVIIFLNSQTSVIAESKLYRYGTYDVEGKLNSKKKKDRYLEQYS